MSFEARRIRVKISAYSDDPWPPDDPGPRRRCEDPRRTPCFTPRTHYHLRLDENELDKLLRDLNVEIPEAEGGPATDTGSE
jgi:hypothetical protein